MRWMMIFWWGFRLIYKNTIHHEKLSMLGMCFHQRLTPTGTKHWKTLNHCWFNVLIFDQYCFQCYLPAGISARWLESSSDKTRIRKIVQFSLPKTSKLEVPESPTSYCYLLTFFFLSEKTETGCYSSYVLKYTVT